MLYMQVACKLFLCDAALRRPHDSLQVARCNRSYAATRHLSSEHVTCGDQIKTQSLNTGDSLNDRIAITHTLPYIINVRTCLLVYDMCDADIIGPSL